MGGPCWSLNGIELLAGMNDPERQKIARICRCLNYNKGADVVKRGDKSNEVIFIVSGGVQVFIYSESDKLIALDNIAAGGFCGELAAIDNRGRSASVRVVEDDTRIALLSQQDFWNLLEANHEVAARVMVRLANLVRKSTEQVIGLGFRDWWRQLVPKLVDRSALIVGVLYLYVSLVGVLVSYALYYRFDINVFSYFDVADFLLSGLKEPFILLIPVGAFLFAIVYLAWSYGWQRLWEAQVDRWIDAFDQPSRTKNFLTGVWLRYWQFQKRLWDSPSSRRTQNIMNLAGAAGFFILSFAYVYEVPTLRADAILEGSALAENEISIEFKKDGKGLPHDLKNVLKIGSTQKFLFVYYRKAETGQATTDQDGTVYILPISEIVRISTRLDKSSKETTSARGPEAETK
jgi:hypothetical protein